MGLIVLNVGVYSFVCFFKQKTAYDMRISDWISDVCSSDLDYAEAAEFFEALSRRALDEQAAAGIDPTEFTLNRALQRSKLGEFAEPERLFAEVEAIPTGQPVQLRRRLVVQTGRAHVCTPVPNAHH